MSWLAACAMTSFSQAVDTATIDGKDYTYDSIQVWTNGTTNTTASPATWLGGGVRYTTNNSTALANAGTLIIGTGTAIVGGVETTVTGGQLFLDGWGSSSGVTLAHDLLVGATGYSEGDWTSAIRFGGDGGVNKKVVLSGTVTLAADTVFTVGGTFAFLDGTLSGEGKKLTLKQNGTLNLSGVVTLGELELNGITTMSLNATNSAGVAVSTLHDISVKSGTGTLTVNSGVTLNIGTQSAGTLNALEGSTINYSGSSFAGSVTGAGNFVKKGDAALAAGSSFTVKNLTVEGGSIDFAGGVIVSGGSATLAGGNIDNLTLNVARTLKQTGAGTLGNLTLDGGIVSFEGLDNSGYTLTGNLTLGSTITTLDLTGSANFGIDSVLFSGVSFGDSFTWDDSAWARYFVFDGTSENWRVVFDETTSSLKIAANTAAELTWNNAGGSGLWNTTDANWSDGSGTVAFQTGDAVTFSDSGTVTIDNAGVVASKITVQQGSLTWTGGSVAGPTLITGGAILTLQNSLTGVVTLDGASTLNIGEGGSLAGNVTASAGSTVNVNSGTFSGAVNLNNGSSLNIGESGIFDGALTFEDGSSSLTIKKIEALSSNVTISGAGQVCVAWGTQSGNIDACLSSFTGELQITSGRYAAGASPLSATSITVTDGGQMFVESGTWTQSFSLAGSGWTSSSDVARAGALRLDNATISGIVTLAADAGISVWSGRTGTISTAIVGNNHTLTKVGAGTLVLGNANNSDLALSIDAGTVRLSQAASYNFKSIAVGAGTTLQTTYHSAIRADEITFQAGSNLELGQIGNSTITFGQMTVNGQLNIKNQTFGSLTLNTTGADAAGIVGNNGILHFTTGSGTDTIVLAAQMSGTLGISKDVGGTLEISHANNTFTGDTVVSAGTIKVSGSINGAENTYSASGSGNMIVSGTGKIQNSAVTVQRNGTSEASISRTTIGTSSISKEAGATEQGAVSHASIDISATAYAIESVSLADSLVTLSAAGSIDLKNVTLSGATRVVGNAGAHTVTFSESSSLTMLSSATGTAYDSFNAGSTVLTSVYVYDLSSYFSNVTLTGHLDIDVSALIDGLPGGNKYVAFDFGSDNGVTLGEGFAAGVTPNAFNSGVLDGTVAGNVVYFETKYVPEPTGAALGLTGLTGLLLRRRRKN